MAKTKQDKKLYSKMRDNGIRKSVAKDLSKLPAHVSGGKQAPKPLRDAIERLEGLVKELRGHTDSGDRQTAARKAARTRKPERRQPLGVGSQGGAHAREVRHEQRERREERDRPSARAPRPRSRARGTAASKSRTAASRRSKSRTGAATAKSRSGATASKPRARRSTAKSTGSRGSS